MAAPHILKAGAIPGEHGVYVRTPLGPGPSANWYATEQQAREEFRRTVETLQADEGSPGLFKVQRVESGSIVEEELVVRRPLTYR